MKFVTMEKIVSALRNTLGKKGMSEEEIKDLAEYIMSFFGYETEVIDNILTSEDRDVFYMLEEEGILSTTQEQINLKKGKLWRIHYWVLKGDQIERLCQDDQDGDGYEDEFAHVYEEIEDDIWSRNTKDRNENH